MGPVIGVTCSTQVAAERKGMLRYAVPTAYVDVVVAAGGLPLVLPSVEPDTAAAYLARIDGLLLTGGDDVDPSCYGRDPHPELGEVDPARDRFEVALVRGARAAGTPVLGICRGIQLLNAAFGGTLVQDVPSEVTGAIQHQQRTVTMGEYGHALAAVPGTRFARIAGAESFRVNSYHHQAVDRVADGLVVTARSPDGIVEGLEDPAHPFLEAVQWHPERLPEDRVTVRLLRAFVEAAAASARKGARPAAARTAAARAGRRR
jgi:putative glutamine amidotransferase